MNKKILAFAVGALLSFNASAGYVQYDFSGPLSGHFIQHDTDQSIAYFKIDFPIDVGWKVMNWGLTPQVSEGGTVITKESTYFRNNGPTNFTIFSNFGADQITNFEISFSRSTQGNFEYTAAYSSSILFSDSNGSGFFGFAGTHTGIVTKGVVNPVFASEALDYYGGYYDGIVAHIVPTFIGNGSNNVPEPASIALLAVGAIGALGAARRRKAAA